MVCVVRRLGRRAARCQSRPRRRRHGCGASLRGLARRAIEDADPRRWVLPCPRGCEEVLASEVRDMDVEVTDVRPTAVHAKGSLREGYRLVLGSRVASRVLLPLLSFECDDDAGLYAALREIPWWEHFDPHDTFAIGSSQSAGGNVPAHFWVQRAKDAIVDAFREHGGGRPSVDKQAPDVRFHLHIGDGKHELSLDYSGEGQHRRGYRTGGGRAPLKENLAAAVLYLADWPTAAKQGLSLVDPTCGSGTFLIEAAMMATHRAPGLGRSRFGFERWLGHDQGAFDAERTDALHAVDPTTASTIHGYDASAQVLDLVRKNLEAAGVGDTVSLAQRAVGKVDKPASHGVVVCNPPYGHRLGDDATLFLFYQALGDMLKRGFDGWTAFVLAANEGNAKYLGLRAQRKHVLFNGAIECRLLEIPITGAPASSGAPSWRKPSDKAGMFVNRVKKNDKKRRRWAKQARVGAYRVYDADIPEYRVAVDRYGDGAVVHVYPRSYSFDDDLAKQRVQDVLITLPEALGISDDAVFVKVRRKHEQGDQYARLSQGERELTVTEGDLRFAVNLEDRIDTGLFLDHRIVRSHARKSSKGKRVLNLFAYTCSVSVAAAVGGAERCTSVDLSNTYLDWGRRNFTLNDLDPGAHRFIREDALRWLRRDRERYDWIFINPPTFSRSKKTKDDFSIHKHHAPLLDAAMALLNPSGELLFTTHARNLEIDAGLERRFDIAECSKELVPDDFQRSPFAAYRIKRRR
ncbi:MAG: bifunctional 23S rRNA (guanine(2069)-N(7))-methyltransferase RlmK/23S rRNA (guanine(2445)-N(2))-methyltransferase RlmL [Myxococcota bacterium]